MTETGNDSTPQERPKDEKSPADEAEDQQDAQVREGTENPS